MQAKKRFPLNILPVFDSLLPESHKSFPTKSSTNHEIKARQQKKVICHKYTYELELATWSHIYIKLLQCYCCMQQYSFGCEYMVHFDQNWLSLFVLFLSVRFFHRISISFIFFQILNMLAHKWHTASPARTYYRASMLSVVCPIESRISLKVNKDNKDFLCYIQVRYILYPFGMHTAYVWKFIA